MTEVEPSPCGQLIIYQALGDLKTTGGGNGVLGLGGEQHPTAFEQQRKGKIECEL
jgi:hypothetical protein